MSPYSWQDVMGTIDVLVFMERRTRNFKHIGLPLQRKECMVGNFPEGWEQMPLLASWPSGLCGQDHAAASPDPYCELVNL